MSFKFRVYLDDGTDLDDYTSAVPNWTPGDVLYDRGMPAYRVTAVIPVGNVDQELYAGILQVEPI